MFKRLRSRYRDVRYRFKYTVWDRGLVHDLLMLTFVCKPFGHKFTRLKMHDVLCERCSTSRPREDHL